MRSIHRIITLFIVVVTVYLGITGTLIQLTDLRTLLTHAPESDPNMEAIREGGYGPGPFRVIANPDYTAAALPAGLDIQASLATTLKAARSIDGNTPLSYLEVRMANDQPVGQVKLDKQVLRFDAVTGEHIPGTVIEPKINESPDSIRNTFKRLHRMTAIGDWTLWINVVVGVALCVMLVTGTVMYFKLLAARKKMKRSGWFWSAGGWWRSLHRWVSVTSAVFLLVVALSGLWLAVESLSFGIYIATHGPPPGAMPSPPKSSITPLNDADVAAMAKTTLMAYRTAQPDIPARAVRLRVYAGMPQGVVVTGADEAEQLVFNASSGRRASQTEPGYPETGFPFGWQAHQIAKQVHRGDFIGLSGRWMDLFAGLAMIYLSISGVVMYVDMWKKRRSIGRHGLVWK